MREVYHYDEDGWEYWIDPPTGCTIKEAQAKWWPIRHVYTGRHRDDLLEDTTTTYGGVKFG